MTEQLLTGMLRIKTNKVITRSISLRPDYQPKSSSLIADKGQGLILRAITKHFGPRSGPIFCWA